MGVKNTFKRMCFISSLPPASYDYRAERIAKQWFESLQFYPIGLPSVVVLFFLHFPCLSFCIKLIYHLYNFRVPLRPLPPNFEGFVVKGLFLQSSIPNSHSAIRFTS